MDGGRGWGFVFIGFALLDSLSPQVLSGSPVFGGSHIVFCET